MNTQNPDQSVTRIRLFGRLGLAVSLVVAALLVLKPSDRAAVVAPDASQPTVAPATLASYSPRSVATPEATPSSSDGTRPIETIRVGERVFAHNPEVTSVERASWQEPDWHHWVHLSLQMPLENSDRDGEPKVLNIEILRPEQWLREQLGWLTAKRDEQVADDTGLENTEAASDNSSVITPVAYVEDTRELSPVPLSPLRGYYRDIVLASALLDANGIDVVGLTLEMDLPEMGAVGTAVITDIQPCPIVPTGAGQVVTATFSHPPSHQVLDVQFEGEPSPIGVTDNHRFWSVDRHEFLPIGQMQPGERVQTFHGDTKRIEQKLPRPGPQVVYNLEVYGEHVYFVGEQGLLAHNMYEGPRGSAGLPRTLAQQRELSIITQQARDRLAGNFDELADALSNKQLRSIAREPWRLRLFFGTAIEEQVAKQVQRIVSRDPDSVLAGLHWTGRTNAPQDFFDAAGFGFDITGNSVSSVRSHFARPEVNAVITYESIPSNLGYEFIRSLGL